VKRDRTPAILASPGLPPAGTDQAQAELRRLRRGRLLHTYPATFDIALEVEQVCSSLAARVMLRPNPSHYFDEVDGLADSVYFASTRLATMIARAHAAPHINRLPVDIRGPEMKRILAAQPRPPRPSIDEKALQTGSWLSTLIELVSPLAGPLGRLLGAPARSAPSASQRLEDLLRGIDDAALSLARKLKAAECRPPVAPPNRFQAVTQSECREARRTGRRFEWPREFDVAAEVSEITEPLAALAAEVDDPASLSAAVASLVGAVHESVVEFADMIARSDAAARTRNVPVDQRGTARRLVRELAAPPPPRPVITQAAIKAGSWAQVLTELARPYAAPLATLLGAGVVLRGDESVSEKLEEALTRIDRAALNLERRIDRVQVAALRHAETLARGPAVAVPADDKADKARAELSRLGVRIP
jgi:hypothetical protein